LLGCDLATVLGQGTKLNVEATVASLVPLDGEFLVLITFTKKNLKKTQQAVQGSQNGNNLQSLPADAVPSQGVSHEDWLTGHTQPRVEIQPCEGIEDSRSRNTTHTSASEETWRAVAADLASFSASPPVDPTVLLDGNAFSSLQKLRDDHVEIFVGFLLV